MRFLRRRSSIFSGVLRRMSPTPLMPCLIGASTTIESPLAFCTMMSMPPSMRLKLAGAVVLRESECLCASAHGLSFNYTARGGRVARSLSAIRSTLRTCRTALPDMLEAGGALGGTR